MRAAFRVDANALMGGGHVMRCLSLANTLRRQGFETIFVFAIMPAALLEHVSAAGHAVRSIACSPEMNREGAGWEAEPLSTEAQRRDAEAMTQAVGGRADWLVVDHYLLDRRWENAARRQADRILVLDDLANRLHDCDLLLDQTLGRERGDYSTLVLGQARLLLGPLYALLRPEFVRERPASLARRRSPGVVRRIFISLGATDVGGCTIPAARAGLAAAGELEVDVVIGRSAPSVEELRALAEREPRLRLHVDTQEMAALMRDADLAIGASGSTSWERCCLGLPTVALVLADNQRLVAEKLTEGGSAYVAHCADALPETLFSLIADPARRLAMTAAAAALADGWGVERVSREMLSTGQLPGKIEIRPVRATDSEALWLWRNDPATRAASRSRAAVAWPDHAAWFERMLSSEDGHLFLAECGGRAIGMVRFDRLTGAEPAYEVSINLSPDARGGGTGRAVLAAGCRYWLQENGPVRLEAAVHLDNAASRRIFEALGFAFSRTGGDGFGLYVRPASLASECGIESERRV